MMRSLRIWSLCLLPLFQACAPQTTSEISSTADDDVWNQELRTLTLETPRTFPLESLYQDLGYATFPQSLFARKGSPTAEERAEEKTPGSTTDSAAHRFLMRLGQQIYQQALLAQKTNDMAYADNALLLIDKLVEADLGFINDPRNSIETNDNRYLEIGWFLSLVARGAHILDFGIPGSWKTQNRWEETKQKLNAWIGPGIDQNWRMAEALQQTPLNLSAQAGTMNWVGSIDTLHGSTNRSFAMLEAQFRIAELRGGNLGPMKLTLNAGQKSQGLPAQMDGSMPQLFKIFRGYLNFYFNKPISQNPKEFILNYDPNRNTLNSNPLALNEEPCLDPLKWGFQASCLLNKDAYRNDTYHPLMGLASVLHIIDIASRGGLTLPQDEQEKVIKGLRWASLNNTPGVTAAKGSSGIAVWELAFRLFPAEDLGPYCQRDLDFDRQEDNRKKAALAWGYSRVAWGF